MNVYVYEDQLALNFEPLSLTRPVCDIRIGSETFLDRIKYLFPDSSITLIVRDNLSDIAIGQAEGKFFVFNEKARFN